MREFLKGLELDKEVIDKIMTEYGKNLQGLKDQVEEYKIKVDEYKAKSTEYTDKIKELTDANKDSQKIQEELDTLKQKIAEDNELAKAKEEDAVITNNIVKVFGDKKFTSEYARTGLINDIKSELKKEENKGLGIQDIFDTLTKDKTDIFVNPNQVKDMEGMGDTDTTVSKDAFDKMTYAQRVEFKQNNPELFEKYNV